MKNVFCSLYTRYTHGKQQIEKKSYRKIVMISLYKYLYRKKKKKKLFQCFMFVVIIGLIKPWMMLFNRFNLYIKIRIDQVEIEI
jgi:hypothetical protein